MKKVEEVMGGGKHNMYMINRFLRPTSDLVQHNTELFLANISAVNISAVASLSLHYFKVVVCGYLQ